MSLSDKQMTRPKDGLQGPLDLTLICHSSFIFNSFPIGALCFVKRLTNSPPYRGPEKTWALELSSLVETNGPCEFKGRRHRLHFLLGKYVARF